MKYLVLNRVLSRLAFLMLILYFEIVKMNCFIKC